MSERNADDSVDVRERAWAGVLDQLVSDGSKRMAGLLPLAEACSRRPRLRRLYPYTAVDRLCLSRTSTLPFDDVARAFAVADGRFRVMRGGRPEREPDSVLGEGTAEEAASLAEDNLADD
jgi:hypothetical protein